MGADIMKSKVVLCHLLLETLLEERIFGKKKLKLWRPYEAQKEKPKTNSGKV